MFSEWVCGPACDVHSSHIMYFDSSRSTGYRRIASSRHGRTSKAPIRDTLRYCYSSIADNALLLLIARSRSSWCVLSWNFQVRTSSQMCNAHLGIHYCRLDQLAGFQNIWHVFRLPIVWNVHVLVSASTLLVTGIVRLPMCTASLLIILICLTLNKLYRQIERERERESYNYILKIFGVDWKCQIKMSTSFWLCSTIVTISKWHLPQSALGVARAQFARIR